MIRSVLATTLECALGVLGFVALAVLVADTASGQAPRAKIVSVEGATTTYQVEGMHGQTVMVDVPSHSTADIKMSNKEQGTVQGKVVALDAETNRVKVHTQEGQTIVLEMPRASLMSLRLGDAFVLAVPRPGQ